MTNTSHHTHATRKFALRLLAATAIAGPLAVAAQTASAQDAAADVTEVVVTGSRVARTGFVTPTPTTAVGQELLQQNTAASIATSLTSLPAFRADQTAATSGPRAEQTPGSSYANLRGLGSTRTLVLINGERVVPSNPFGTVDLNTIPSLLVDRIDVVTGGASAAYGSDAVSGVVNMILNKNLNGFRADISYGESSRHDNVERRVAVAGGMDFADGRGHILAGAEWSENDGVGLMYNRRWGRDSYGNLPNPNVTASNPKSASNPANLQVPLYQPSNTYVGGVITSGPLRGVTFEQGGVLGTFDYGNIVGPNFMSGGSGYYVQWYNTNLNPPAERKNALLRVDYDVTDNFKVHAEGSYAQSHSLNRGGTPRHLGNGVANSATGPITIRTDNPYMPAALVTRMTAAGLTSISSVGRYDFDLGPSLNDGNLKTGHVSVGAEGSFGENWTWDAHASYGKTKFVENTRNTVIIANYFKSVDAVRNGAGQIVCRVNADAITTNDDAACVPANIFGPNSISQAAHDYITEDQYYENVVTQKVIAANLRGEPFSTWAGPVSLALGAEARKEKSTGKADPLSMAAVFYVGNQKPVIGDVTVKEAYAEAVLPLLDDVQFAKHLELDLAARRTDYSTAGQVTTWKIGGNWEVNDQIRFRATRSRDIRAPNLNELFSKGNETISGVFNNVLKTSPLVPQTVVGFEGLKYEVANTTTVGVVVRPSFIPGLDISVDYFRINLKDSVGTLTATQVAEGCQLQNIAELCSQIVFSPTGEFQRIFRPYFNVATVKTRGWDIEARYRVPLGSFDVPGSLTLQAYVSNLAKQLVDDGTGVLKDYAGEVGNQGLYGGPKWRATMLATYSNGPFSVTGTVRWIGPGKFRTDWTEADLDDNTIPHRTYFNLSGSYDVNDNIEVYGVVANLFDQDPPIAPNIAWPTNPQYFDMIGRTYKMGVRLKY